jgi:hypothetical protein
MRVIYAPNGETPREWSFDPWALDWDEAEKIELLGGQSWSSFYEFCQQLQAEGVRARAVTVWFLLAREDPGLKLADLKMRAGDSVVTFEPAEMEMIREAMAQDPDLTPEQREAAEVEMTRVSGPLGSAASTSPPEDSPPETSENGDAPTAAT